MHLYVAGVILLVCLGLFDIALIGLFFLESKTKVKQVVVLLLCLGCYYWFRNLSWYLGSTYFSVSSVICTLPLVRLGVCLGKNHEAYPLEIRTLQLVSFLAAMSWTWLNPWLLSSIRLTP